MELFAVEGRSEETPLPRGDHGWAGEAVVAYPQHQVLAVEGEVPGEFFRRIAEARYQSQRICLF